MSAVLMPLTFFIKHTSTQSFKKPEYFFLFKLHVSLNNINHKTGNQFKGLGSCILELCIILVLPQRCKHAGYSIPSTEGKLTRYQPKSITIP